jgi:hypothetical protein
MECAFTLWCRLHDTGDGHCSGTIIEDHCEPLSKYFSAYYCTGKLSEEPCIDGRSDHDDEQDAWDTPLVLKIAVDSNEPIENPHTSLSRSDVLKQMFDGYINRVLAYGFQTHLGLVTFGTKASISQPSPTLSRTSVTSSIV